MQRLINILKELHPECDFSGNERLIDDGIFDSLDIVTLVTDINSVYGISIGAEDIVKENFATRDDIVKLIISRGGDPKCN